MTVHEAAHWRCRITLAKFWGNWRPELEPYEVLHVDGNMLMHGGVSNLWRYLVGDPGATTTAGQTLTFFDADNAAIGVGDGITTESAVQTDLQGVATARKGMNSGYPEHTPGTDVDAKTIRFRSTFDTTEANFSWQEAAVFNSVTSGVGQMLNRKVQDMGVKTDASSFQVTFDISID